MTLGCVALLAATQAGRPGEDGSGAMWIAPELIPPKVADHCTHRAPSASREIVFELISLDDGPDTASLLGDTRRPVVFEWNAATGELSIAGSAGTRMFRDVRGTPVAASPLQARSCGSR
jgi:hypothetical protein